MPLQPPPEAEIDAALLDALRPRDLRERVRVRLLGGFSAIQALDRLPDELRERLYALAGSPALARRQAVDLLAARLRALYADGRVARARASLATDVRVKGIRLIEVDLYQLVRGSGSRN